MFHFVFKEGLRNSWESVNKDRGRQEIQPVSGSWDSWSHCCNNQEQTWASLSLFYILSLFFNFMMTLHTLRCVCVYARALVFLLHPGYKKKNKVAPEVAHLCLPVHPYFLLLPKCASIITTSSTRMLPISSNPSY